MEDRADTDRRELEELRQAFAAAAGPPPAPERCPPPERIWAAAHGELPPAEAREVVDHMAGCPACAEYWRLALTLREEVAPIDEPDECGEVAEVAAAAWPVRPVRPPALPAPFPHRRSLYTSVAALAAAACLLVAVGVQQRTHEPQPPVNRAAPEAEIRSLVGTDSLPRDHFRLCWSPVKKKGTTYDLLVKTRQLKPVARKRGLTSHCYTVPPAALAKLPQGSRLAWQVDAKLGDGRTVSSGTFPATVR